MKSFVAIAAQYVSKLNEIAYFIGWAVYFYASQVIWKDAGSHIHCFQGYNLIDFIHWIFLLIFTLPNAIVLTGVILCLPCLCYQRTIFKWRIWKSVQALQAEEEEAERQANGESSNSDVGGPDADFYDRQYRRDRLPRRVNGHTRRISEQIQQRKNLIARKRFDPDDFINHTECSICCQKYTEQCEISPLPCNPLHFFHSACLVSWLKKNNSCPLCRKVFTEDEIFKKNCQLEVSNGFSDFNSQHGGFRNMIGAS